MVEMYNVYPWTQAGDMLSVGFYYLVGLDVVTVQGKVVLHNSVFAGEVLEVYLLF